MDSWCYDLQTSHCDVTSYAATHKHVYDSYEIETRTRTFVSSAVIEMESKILFQSATRHTVRTMLASMHASRPTTRYRLVDSLRVRVYVRIRSYWQYFR